MDEKMNTPAAVAAEGSKKTNKERLKEITDSIEAGIRDLFDSEKYKNYLRTMSKFHNYSFNNTMLIHMQMPEATRVASFNSWRDKFHRNVKRGEHGIKIIAPTPYIKRTEEIKRDPETNAPMVDQNGEVIMEEKQVKIPRFKIVTVFDVSQTYGEPLPQLASDLTGDVQQFDIFMEALKRSAPVPMEVQPLAQNLDGYFSQTEQKIVIREGMSEVQTICAAVHEIAHSKLHNKNDKNSLLDDSFETIDLFNQPALFSDERIDRSKLPDGLYAYDIRGNLNDLAEAPTVVDHVEENEKHGGTVISCYKLDVGDEGLPLSTHDLTFEGEHGGRTVRLRDYWEQNCPYKANKSQRIQEVEAESIAFSVCAYYSVETGEQNSFGYIASWSSGEELKELKASLETINRTAGSLIKDIDKNFDIICKERGIDRSEKQAEPRAHEALFLLDDDIYLHVQRRSEDIDYDYSLYTADTLKLMDGGVTTLPEDSTLIDAPLIVVADELLKDLGIHAASITPVDLNKLHEIEETNAVVPPAEIMPEPEPVRELGKLDEYPMPDASVDPKLFEKAGIDDADILPVSPLSALMFMEEDFSVYSVTPEKTGADISMCMDSDEIEACAPDTMFAIDREEWEKSPMFQHMIDERLEHQEEREAGFFAHPGSFAIYQMDHSLDSIPLRFSSYDELVERDMAPTRDMYELIYTAELGKKGLDDIFYEFNENRPPDYRSYSLSASDIIARNEEGAVSYYYVDRFGFQELPNFAAENPLKNAEMAVEDDYNMVDGIIIDIPIKS